MEVYNKLCKTVLRPPLFSFDVETSILESLSLRSFQRGATLLPSRRHSPTRGMTKFIVLGRPYRLVR